MALRVSACSIAQIHKGDHARTVLQRIRWWNAWPLSFEIVTVYGEIIISPPWLAPPFYPRVRCICQVIRLLPTGPSSSLSTTSSMVLASAHNYASTTPPPPQTHGSFGHTHQTHTCLFVWICLLSMQSLTVLCDFASGSVWKHSSTCTKRNWPLWKILSVHEREMQHRDRLRKQAQVRLEIRVRISCHNRKLAIPFKQWREGRNKGFAQW